MGVRGQRSEIAGERAPRVKPPTPRIESGGDLLVVAGGRGWATYLAAGLAPTGSLAHSGGPCCRTIPSGLHPGPRSCGGLHQGPASVGNSLCLEMVPWGHPRVGWERCTPISSDRLLPWETCFVWKNPGRQVCAAPCGLEAHAWSEESRPACARSTQSPTAARLGSRGGQGFEESAKWRPIITQGCQGLRCGRSQVRRHLVGMRTPRSRYLDGRPESVLGMGLAEGCGHSCEQPP
jgi:hypothetical protein